MVTAQTLKELGEEIFQLIALPSLVAKYLLSAGPANTEGGQTP